MRISVMLLGLLLGLMAFGQNAFTKMYHSANFKVHYKDKDFTWEGARDLALGLEEAREFYQRNGFSVPTFKIKVKLQKKKGNLLGGYNPVTRNIKIIMPVDEDTGQPSGLNDTRAKRRFTAAHELFHAVTFISLPFSFERFWSWAYVKKKKLNGEAEFWLFFEGLAETMAWMVFPEIGADANDGETAHGRFWYGPTIEDDPTTPLCGEYPHVFLNPWKILPDCALTNDLEVLGYYTVPFWLGLSQRITGPPENGNYDASAAAILQVMQAVKHQSKSYSRAPDAVKAGIDSFLSNHGMERKDIRDMMSLSAGVERFGDEIPLDRDSDWTALFRDFESAGNEIENWASHLSWAIDYQLAPPNIEPKNTIHFQHLVTNLTGKDGQLESFNYAGSLNPFASEDDLPTFAGEDQGLSDTKAHPLDTVAVPPGTIQFMDLTPNPTPIARPVAVAGYNRPGSTLFPPRMVKIIPGEAPVTLSLHNFRLKDLSVMRVFGRNSNMQYRYTFLDEHKSKLGYAYTTMVRPGVDEWIIREVDRPSLNPSLPTSYLPGAFIMLTPATVPKGLADTATLAWTDSNIFDVVIRSEDAATGEWSNVSASTNVYQTTVPFPAVSPVPSGGKKERIRVDIARFEPGNHGGGNFFLTAALRDSANPNKPDLLVRASTVDFIKEARSGRVPPVSLTPMEKCQPTAKIVAYVTNQGDAVASNVSVRIKGKMKITLNKQGTNTNRVSFNQTIMVPLDFQPGETRAVGLRVQAPSRGLVASVQGKIIIDPNHGVDEHVETNNEADIPFIDYECSP